MTEHARKSAAIHGAPGKKHAVKLEEGLNEGDKYMKLSAKYAPCIASPGFYTVKLALDDYEDGKTAGDAGKAKKLSQKSYYGAGPLVQVLDEPSIAFGAFRFQRPLSSIR
jgi:hypothetical protein